MLNLKCPKVLKKLIYCGAVLLFVSHLSGAIAITGANGKVAEFAGIVSASPKGLRVMSQPGGEWTTIPWEQIKLDVLKAKNAKIHAAYEKTKKSKGTEYLKLGVFAGKILYIQSNTFVSHKGKVGVILPTQSHRILKGHIH